MSHVVPLPIEEALLAQGFLREQWAETTDIVYVRPTRETEWVGIKKLWNGEVEVSVPLSEGSVHQFRTTFAAVEGAWIWLAIYLGTALELEPKLENDLKINFSVH